MPGVRGVPRGIVALWALAWSGAVTPAPMQEPPELLIEGPAELRAAQESVARISPDRFRAVMRLVGLEDPGPPIHVLVVPEGSPGAVDVPPWVAGYADTGSDLIVLLPERTPSYPDASFEALVVHEVAHVLIDRAAGPVSLPRWFHEGVATAAGSWGVGDRTRVALALLLQGDRSLAQLERDFSSGEQATVERAYAMAAAFVRDLQSREGEGAVARILAAGENPGDFETAFAQGTGSSLALAERAFWRRHERWYRWIPLLASSTVLWAGIVLLAFWARGRRAARAARIQERWEAEDREPGDVS